eukprot:1103399-Lingulodinium_polyedra.AAC.1
MTLVTMGVARPAHLRGSTALTTRTKPCGGGCIVTAWTCRWLRNRTTNGVRNSNQQKGNE